MQEVKEKEWEKISKLENYKLQVERLDFICLSFSNSRWGDLSAFFAPGPRDSLGGPDIMFCKSIFMFCYLQTISFKSIMFCYLQKLEHCGVQQPALSWFQSYLSNRKQYCRARGGVDSLIGKIEVGVPQGS